MSTPFAGIRGPRGGGRAQAGYVVSGTSGGVDVSANLTFLGSPLAALSVNGLQGTSPSPYNVDSSLANASLVAGMALSGSTGVIDTTMFSNVAGSNGPGAATSGTTIHNLNLGVLGSLLSIQATTLSTTSSVAGAYGSLTATGVPMIANLGTGGLSISLLGVDITSTVLASAGTVVDIKNGFGLDTGVSLGIDVVTVGGDGISARSVVTDNIIVELASVNIAGVGLFSGTIDIGQSEASLIAAPGVVPEPSSIAMMGVGLALAGTVGVRRGRTKRPIANT